jgi:hypothetical protein
MRRRFPPIMVILIILMVILPSASLFAVDISEYGFTVVSSFKEQGKTVHVVRDMSGNTFEFIGESVSNRQAQIILRVMKDFSELRYLSFKSIRIVPAENKIEALLVPSAFSYKGVDFTRYLPSGLQFYYKDYLEYDFRMFISKLFVRVREQYLDETSLAENMLEAVNDPIAYIRTHDPDYIIKKFISVDEKIGLLEEENQQAKKEIERLEKQLAEAAAESEENIRQLKMSTVQVASQRAFSKLKEMDPSAVERVIALKSADSSLTVDDAVAKLKEEEIKLTSNQVLIIFTVFFPSSVTE